MADAPQLPMWNSELADALPGAKVIVRVVGERPDGVQADMQFWGIVASAQKDKGIEIALEGSRKGDTYWTPPDHRSIRRANPGKYKLAPSGDEVENPDFIIFWVVRPVKAGGASQGDAPGQGG